MPWRTAFRAKAKIPYVLVALSMAVVVSCTTVPLTPAADADRSGVALPVATPSGELSPTSAPDSTPDAGPTVEPTPSPTVAPTPSPTVVPTALPTPPPTVAPTPSPTAAPTAVPEATTPVEPALDVDGPTLDEKTVAKLQKIIDNQVENKDVAGLQVAVRLPSGETWLGAAGNAEFSPDRALENDTQLAIASVTKTFVAALVLQLAEEGKVDLDATFGTYFRDAPRKDKVTLRQLLSHRSGIYNFWANPRYGEITQAWWKSPNAGGLKDRSRQWTYEEMMDLVKSGKFKPGEDYEYSNTNYLILGQVAEAVEGIPLHKQLRQRFFKPLGLDDTIYQPEQKPRADAAHGHWAWPGGHTDHTQSSAYVPFMAAASIADAAGAMASTAGDLAAWAAELYGGDVLTPGMREQMTTFLSPGWYGLGADVAVFAGNRGHGHRGGIRGYESSMWFFPKAGVSIVLVSNQGNWNTDVPMEKLVKTVLGSN